MTEGEGFDAKARVVETLGSDTIAYVRVEEVGEMTVRLPGHIRLKDGERLKLRAGGRYDRFEQDIVQRPSGAGGCASTGAISTSHPCDPSAGAKNAATRRFSLCSAPSASRCRS